jgi:phenylpyruvate tautomerase PptA (4-oxalocrotonate tautomerase family)
MPLVQISLIRGRKPETIRAIADGVHRALVETFSIPPDDRFQLIQQYDADSLIYDPDYMGVHRTPEVVFINITASNWRDTAAKQALYRRVKELLTTEAGVRAEDIVIVLTPNTKEDWSFGNGIASYVQKAVT